MVELDPSPNMGLQPLEAAETSKIYSQQLG
jgi:hypothetical protein